METEIEAKFPQIDAEKLRLKLKEIGAVLVYPEVAMRRKTFDLPSATLYKKGGWVRVRDEGNTITLTYKQLNDRTLHGTKEITVSVDDFEKTCELLIAIGFVQKSFQETKREKWRHGDVEITIDTWPWVPTFAEIEGLTERAVKETARTLGFDWRYAMHGSVENIYQIDYDFTGAEIDGWQEITFIDPPEWFLKRKKK